jgi:hypothetical protein
LDLPFLLRPECFEGFTQRTEGSSSSDVCAEHIGKMCAKKQAAILHLFAHCHNGNERRILFTGNDYGVIARTYEQ